MTVFVPISGQAVVYKGITQLTGVQISIYDAQTLTPRQAFRDGLAISSWAQPISGDSNGCVPNIWIVGAPYKIRIVAAHGAYTREIDNLPGDVAAGGGGGGGGGTATLNTGDFIWAHTTAVITGRVRANGRTIGSAISGATERANDDVQNLFVFLWNADSALIVSGGRGISATADFAASKTITLPDYNARSMFGIDGMGSSATGRLAGVTFASGNATTLGSTGGEGVHILTATEIAAHTHAGTTQANASFSLTGTTAAVSAGTPFGTLDSQGLHSHTGATTSAGAHSHPGSFSDNIGFHSHGGATTSAGLHSHTYGAAAGFSATGNAGGTFGGIWNGGFVASSQTTDASGTHLHGIAGDGQHQHALSIASDGAHVHGIFADGTHSHNFTGSAMSAHSHTFTTAAGGVHTHTFTTSSAGGDGAHNTCPPFGLATCYLIL